MFVEGSLVVEVQAGKLVRRVALARCHGADAIPNLEAYNHYFQNLHIDCILDEKNSDNPLALPIFDRAM